MPIQYPFDSARMHNCRTVAHVRDDIHVVADQEQCHPMGGFDEIEQVENFCLHRHVQRGSRLIQQQQGGAQQQRARNRDALPLTAGELMRAALRERRHEADLFEGLIQAGAVGAKVSPMATLHHQY